MLARKISASSGVSLARNGRRPAGDLTAEVMAQHHPLQGEVVLACCWSSRNLPGSAILGVLKHDAHGGEFVSDTVGLRTVLGVAGRTTRSNQRFYFILVTRTVTAFRHFRETYAASVNAKEVTARRQIARRVIVAPPGLVR